MNCGRCDVPMILDGRPREAWYCPCCKSRLRTVEMIQADNEARRVSLNLTPEEYEAYMDAEAERLFVKPTARDLEQARGFAARRAAEWTPACEHDTENPWTSAGASSAGDTETSA